MESTRVAAIPFFAGLPDAELVAVARMASELEVATGEAVTNEGDFGHALFAIESGTADVVRGGCPGRRGTSCRRPAMAVSR